MTTEKTLGHAATSAALPAAAEWATMASVAEALVRSGLLPAHVKTPQAALAIMLKGRELGIPAMQALGNIAVVNGKPTCNAELMLALAYRDHGDDALHIEETTAERCTVSYKRRSWAERRTHTFTMADAQRAGLAGSGTWQKYPQALLRARCISAVARMAFPDSIAGMYGYEELGVAVAVEDDGAVVLDQAAVPTPERDSHAAKKGQGQGQTTLERTAEDMAAEDETGDGDRGRDADSALPGQGRPPRTPTVEATRRNEFCAKIRALCGARLETGQSWKDLARTYELVEPASAADMTAGWLEELYARMARRRKARASGAKEERPAGRQAATLTPEQALAGWIAAAPDGATLEHLATDVAEAHEAGTLTDAAATALLMAVDARGAELDLHDPTELDLDGPAEEGPPAGRMEAEATAGMADREAHRREANAVTAG